MTDSEVPSFGVRVLLGLLFAAMGLFPILAAFDIAPMHARDINGPPWLGLVAGGIFVHVPVRIRGRAIPIFRRRRRRERQA